MARSNGLSFYKKQKPVSVGLIREIGSWIFGVVAAIFLAAVLNYCFGMTTYVVGVSMEPVLSNGQKIYIDRVSYQFTQPKAGDIVVFLPNGNKNAHYYVKRVVAVPSDTVVIKDGHLYVNGKASNLLDAQIADAGIASEEITLEKDCYFCIGDSPGSSEDSRSANIGPVRREDIIGKVWFHLNKE